MDSRAWAKDLLDAYSDCDTGDEYVLVLENALNKAKREGVMESIDIFYECDDPYCHCHKQIGQVRATAQEVK